MNGLRLSREYYFSVADPLLKRDFPQLYPRLAVGLAGNGSECFGFDDEISRDHDWGVDFFIWTMHDDRAMVPSVQKWKDNLFKNYPPEYPRIRSKYGAGTGVMTRGDFYSGLIGVPETPKTLREWISAPEENFAMAVNGAVFVDGPGEFTGTRNELLKFYPEDLRRKRIASKCMALAQTGQYNHSRIAKRGDHVTLRTVLSRFTEAAVALAFLLGKTYRPYYKWAYRALEGIPPPGGETARLLLEIAETGGFDDESQDERQRYIDELCSVFISHIREQGLSQSDDWFMTAHAEMVQSGIKDDFLLSLPAQYDI